MSPVIDVMLSDAKTPIRIDIAKKRDKKLGRKSEIRKKLLERGIEKEKSGMQI